MTASRPVAFLRTEAVRFAIFRHHLSHEEFAAELGLSRQHWSVLYNRRRPLTARVRRALVASPRLVGVAEDELFDVVAVPAA